MMVYPYIVSLFWFLLVIGQLASAQGPSYSPLQCVDRPSQNETKWFGKNRTPCEKLQLVMQKCDSSFQLDYLPSNPKDAVCAKWFEKGIANSGGVPANPANNTTKLPLSQCCCNSIVYSLTQACWSCQTGKNETEFPNQRPTYGFFTSPCASQRQPTEAVQASLEAVGIKVPKWASDKYSSEDLDKVWVFRRSQQEQEKQDFKDMQMNVQAQGGNNDKDKKKDKDFELDTVLVVALASVGSFLVAVIASILLFCCLRKRRKLKTDADQQPYADLEKSQQYSRTSQTTLLPHNPWLNSFYSRRNSGGTEYRSDYSTFQYATPSEAGDLGPRMQGGMSDWDAESVRRVSIAPTVQSRAYDKSVPSQVPPTPTIYVKDTASVAGSFLAPPQHRVGLPSSPAPRLRGEDMDISDALTVAESVVTVTRPDRHSNATFGGLALKVEGKS